MSTRLAEAAFFGTKRFFGISERVLLSNRLPLVRRVVYRSQLSKIPRSDLRKHLGRSCNRWATGFVDGARWVVDGRPRGPAEPPCERYVPKTSNSIVLEFSPDVENEAKVLMRNTGLFLPLLVDLSNNTGDEIDHVYTATQNRFSNICNLRLQEQHKTDLIISAVVTIVITCRINDYVIIICDALKR